MQCKTASEMMSARLDGRLDSAELALLEEHTTSCDACQVEWQRLQALHTLLASASMVQPSVRMRVQVMARIQRRNQARRAIIGGAALTLGTVALALIILAPLAMNFLNVLGIAPALISGGPETLAQLMRMSRASGRVALVLVETFAAPLAFMAICLMAAAITLNRTCMRAIRRRTRQ